MHNNSFNITAEEYVAYSEENTCPGDAESGLTYISGQNTKYGDCMPSNSYTFIDTTGKEHENPMPNLPQSTTRANPRRGLVKSSDVYFKKTTKITRVEDIITPKAQEENTGWKHVSADPMLPPGAAALLKVLNKPIPKARIEEDDVSTGICIFENYTVIKENIGDIITGDNLIAVIEYEYLEPSDKLFIDVDIIFNQIYNPSEWEENTNNAIHFATDNKNSHIQNTTINDIQNSPNSFYESIRSEKSANSGESRLPQSVQKIKDVLSEQKIEVTRANNQYMERAERHQTKQIEKLQRVKKEIQDTQDVRTKEVASQSTKATIHETKKEIINSIDIQKKIEALSSIQTETIKRDLTHTLGVKQAIHIKNALDTMKEDLVREHEKDIEELSKMQKNQMNTMIEGLFNS